MNRESGREKLKAWTEMIAPGRTCVREIVHDSPISENACSRPSFLSTRHGKQTIQKRWTTIGRRARVGQTEFLCQAGEATPAYCGPVPDFFDHARQGIRRKILPERFQHAQDHRLTPCAGHRLVGAARVPGLRGRAERPFGFVVRSRNQQRFAVGLLHRLCRDEREELPCQHHPHQFVAQPSIVVCRAFARRQFCCPHRAHRSRSSSSSSATFSWRPSALSRRSRCTRRAWR